MARTVRDVMIVTDRDIVVKAIADAKNPGSVHLEENSALAHIGAADND